MVALVLINEHVTRAQKIGKVREARVSDAIVTQSRYHEAYFVTRQSARLGWLQRHELVRQLELETCIERDHAASIAATAGPTAAAT